MAVRIEQRVPAQLSMKSGDVVRRVEDAWIAWESRWSSPHQTRRLVIFVWAAACVAAGWQAISGLDYIFGDGICYLDIADAMNRGDWDTALNPCWSPLYPAVLAVAMRLAPLARVDQFSIVQGVNFSLFLAAIAAFHFFLRSLVDSRRRRREVNSGKVRPVLSDFQLHLLGYTLFLWTSLWWIGVATATPDMLVAVFVYLASGLLMKLMGDDAPPWRYARMGAILAAGYLAKLIMLPVSLLFAGALLAGAKKSRRTWAAGMGILTLTFVVLAAPFAYSLSRSEGKWTWGESGRLNYIFWVNPAKPHLAYWQDRYPVGRAPEHVPARICDQPLIYYFSLPAGGTYPIWFEAVYWNEGVGLSFDWERQLAVLMYHLRWYGTLAWPQTALLLGLLLLAYLRIRKRVARWSREGLISMIGLVVLGMYVAVHVELRYLGPFVTLLWMGVFATAWWREGSGPPKRASFVSLLLLLVFALQCAYAIARPEAGKLWRRLHGRTGQATHNRLVAREMMRMGIQPGTQVARVATSFIPEWARLAGVRVIAEIPNFYTDESWQTSPEAAQRAMRALKASGARYLVTERPVPEKSVLPWRRLGASGHSILQLSG